MPTIQNPVLPGFHPDPCMVRVGEDYYIANSTFEWWPGVSIHHSKDLVHWHLAARPLDRPSQLDMEGLDNSWGIWAPDLTWANGRFYLIYTVVMSHGMNWKDTPNYLVTATSIEGPWSDPIYLNASGFDPSLFHDEDGKIWLLNMLWEANDRVHRFAGTALQEYDPSAKKLVGPIENIFRGTPARITEGPRMYRKDGWYYLVTAEGGTGFPHQVTVARSRNLKGPYEVHPENPILTSLGDPTNPLQKAGHGSWVEAGDGSWWLAHLTSRPLMTPHAPPHLPPIQRARSILGRETGLQPMVWGKDGWPRLRHGGRFPRVTHEGPALPAHPWPHIPEREDFNDSGWGPEFLTLREGPDPAWISTGKRRGWLTMVGRHSLVSCFKQSLLGRRVEAPAIRCRTRVDFAPEDPWQAAGLLAYYSRKCFYYLKVGTDEKGKPVLTISVMNQGNHRELAECDVPMASPGPVDLQVEIIGTVLRFAFSQDGHRWQEIGPEFDAGILSDEVAQGFTGAFCAIGVQDMSGRFKEAHFDYFEMKTLDAKVDFRGIEWPG